MSTCLRLFVGIILSVAVAVQGAKVTPMEKVISLLKDLSAKVTAEGKKEAAQYDKFACFCKEQADEKLYSIEKSDKQIADLKAQIEALDTSISELNSDIGTLSSKITDLKNEIDLKTKNRATQRARYEARAKDHNEAIAACGAAIDALKGSKGAMEGAKLNLLQAVSKLPNQVSLLSKLNGKGAPKFEYQSNDIIATLEDLEATFKEMKVKLDTEEHDVKSAFEKNKQALSNSKTFAEKERAEKEAIVEAKTEDVEAARTNKDSEQADADADQSFMDELTSECEEKAGLFDQRSKLRGSEISTLAEATEELQKGAAPNFASNKKLVGLQKAAVTKAAKPSSSSVSFVQIRNVQHEDSKKNAVLQKVRSFLAGAATRTGSGMLSTVVARVGLAEDHFVKVRGLIKDLISKLKADALAEADQKSTCDTGMKNAITDRDNANAAIEAANAKITTSTSTKDALNAEMDKLRADIAGLQKGLSEATELRGEDKAENEKTMEMSQAGADSVKLALDLLKGFYNKAFMQTGKYVPPNAGRDGKTVGDLAPETFDSSDIRSQSESKGIVGILEVILSDFERTNKDADGDDVKSKADFEKFEKDTNGDVDGKEKRIKKATSELADANADILENEQALSEAKDLLESGLQKLEDLEAQCVKGEETWEERKQKREDEVEALKSALDILENWQA